MADLQRSIDFYETLGFEVAERYEQEGWLLWVRLRRGSAELMLALASEPVHDHAQGVLFYLYVDDLDAIEADAPVLEHEAPRPAREMRLTDPDGYVVMVAELA
ncbi:MAG TPA: VOC family protein [Thermoleophilaceae bacterium]|nr:VOC family protein [Thermoleophilaceae bacterium]